MTGTGYVTYKDIELKVDYYATPYVPARYYLDNGDPGYPAEGGDFDVEAVYLLGSRVDIYELLSEDTIHEIGSAFIEQNKE